MRAVSTGCTFFLLLLVAGFVEASQEPAPEELICFLFFALLSGAFLTYILTQYFPNVPYTVIVFIFGGVLIEIFTPVYGTDTMKRSITEWGGINPKLLLFIFLPALLFGEAMSLNFHHVRSSILPATLLAGPGALIGAFVVAALIKYILPYDWSWGICLLFGAITCATDPVSVVALLKKCGASNRLTYMITGEALINDGTALVIYNLFYILVRNSGETSFTAADVAIYFLKVIFISPLLGFAFGFGTVFVLQCSNHRMKEEDTIVQVAITLCCAYLSFFVAEHMLGVSGVICCCAAGIILCRFAKPLFLQPETIHAVWATSEWIGNTLIFILAGMIITSRTLEHVNAEDWGYLFLLYVLLNVVRAFVVAIHYPCIHYLHPGFSIGEALFMTWGGLRGAVSMALALSLTQSTEQGETTISNEEAHRIFFFVGGIAALTLLINATTAANFLKWLGLTNDSTTTIEAKIIFQYMKKRMKLKALKLLHDIQSKANDDVYFVDVSIVMKYCSIFRDDIDHGELGLLQQPDEMISDAVQLLSESYKGTVNLKEIELTKKSTAIPLVIQDDKGLEKKPIEPSFEQLYPHKEVTSYHQLNQDVQEGKKSSVTPTIIEPSSGSTSPKPFSNVSSKMVMAVRPGMMHRESSYHHVVTEHLQLIQDAEQQHRRARAVTISANSVDGQQSPHTHEGVACHEENFVPISENTPTLKRSRSRSNTALSRHTPTPPPSSLSVPPIPSSTAAHDTGVEANKKEGTLSEQDAEGNSDLSPLGNVYVDRRSTTALIKPSPQAFPTDTARHPPSIFLPTEILKEQNEAPATLLSSQHTHVTVNYTPFRRKSIVVELLYQIRRAFLDVVRVNYWRQIRSGKLPRDSPATLVLLNSIDYGLETINTPGLQDWEYIEIACSHLLPQRNHQSENGNNCFACSWCCKRSNEQKDVNNNNNNNNNDSVRKRTISRLEAHEIKDNEDEGDMEIGLPDGIRNDYTKARSNSRIVHADSVEIDDEDLVDEANHEDGLDQGSNSGLSNNDSRTYREGNNTSNLRSKKHRHRIAPRIDKIIRNHHSSQLIYTLIAFIEAHQYAQRKIPFYLGETEGIDTIEEAIVVQESIELVDHVKSLLHHMDQQMIITQVSKQTAYWILHLQQDQIEEFVSEGIITEKDADTLYEEIDHDILRVLYDPKPSTITSLAPGRRMTEDDEQEQDKVEVGHKEIMNSIVSQSVILCWQVQHNLFSTVSAVIHAKDIQSLLVAKS